MHVCLVLTLLLNTLQLTSMYIDVRIIMSFRTQIYEYLYFFICIKFIGICVYIWIHCDFCNEKKVQHRWLAISPISQKRTTTAHLKPLEAIQKRPRHMVLKFQFHGQEQTIGEVKAVNYNTDINMFMPLPSQTLDFQRHMSWCFLWSVICGEWWLFVLFFLCSVICGEWWLFVLFFVLSDLRWVVIVSFVFCAQ